jgi:AraC-like DNA-binding protein
MASTEISSSRFTQLDPTTIFGLKSPDFVDRDELAIIVRPLSSPRAAKRVRVIAGLAEWQKNKAIRYIDENVEKNIKVEDIASLVKLSASRFSKAFKVSFGRAPYDYVLSRRIEAAKFMILCTEEPLSQVAHACGLSDQAHLSKVFKRLIGVTPLKYRRAGTRARSALSAHATIWMRLAESHEASVKA